MSTLLTRRKFLAGSSVGMAAFALTGCDLPGGSESYRRIIKMAESLTQGTQRLFLSDKALAREFTEADMSPVFKANGTKHPDGEAYARLLETNFSDWRLVVDGMVNKPLSLSLAELKQLPSRTQITRHDCVEGWSAIGKWTGVPLGLLLQTAGLAPDARYAVLHCADKYEKTLDDSGRYYESIDLVDAFHPQTILAYGMNGGTLPVEHGAPLRLRVERHLGYKHAKYLMRIEIVDSFAHLGRGHGGFWEDRGYEWYAGI